jgi:hypothetical protein
VPTIAQFAGAPGPAIVIDTDTADRTTEKDALIIVDIVYS